MLRRLASLALLCICPPLLAQGAKPFDAAAAFGARPSITDLSLSPDGTSIVYVAPIAGQGSVVYTLSLANGAKEKVALFVNGKPDRLEGCDWVTNDRLVCSIYGVVNPGIGLVPFSRLVAVNADGKNLQLLSKKDNEFTRGLQIGGGEVIDWLPDENGAVLMARNYLPDEHLGSRLSSSREGLGVDRVDTRTLAIKTVEPARNGAVVYISDGRGKVRILGVKGTSNAGNVDTGVITYLYRTPASREWHKLGEHNDESQVGFEPEAVDPDLNVAYGFKKKDGRLALYSVTLDDSPQEKLIYERPDVDVTHLMRIGRRLHVVGVSYVTDTRHSEIFVAEIAQLLTSLSKALPQQPILRVADASIDESKMLVFAGSDTDPGVYYLFDRKAGQLRPLLAVREPLIGAKLASVKPLSYPATDGTVIPGYLTLPPGVESAKGLPAIVMPHGGPSTRDVWGFDWLAQFYASRGFAVLQPNFRGSAGYGDAWLVENGFKSWPIAIGDVLAAGHWLVSQGIADPARLGIVGWSYGGYAALQAAVVEPGFFKAVVAIAPVTDLPALKEEWRGWTNFELARARIGNGPEIHTGSPAEHADKIKVPVLLFHGGMDRNVNIGQSKRMAAGLTAAGVKNELVTWDDLDHQLDDSTARTQMLRQSDAFLRRAFGM
ncbi:MAG TPA: S9 family peptidase [Steroidobacteraceae bacterium]|jgi:dipeptidyl aminopeptidase/acylaminoacyl peptidase|nr:S9 family peptidase [Steroidobacteraceae bacterium]